MATQTLRPNSDISTTLSCSSGSSHYALVDEESGSTSDYIYYPSQDETLHWDVLGLPSPSPAAGTISNVTAYVYGLTVSGTGIYQIATGVDTGAGTTTNLQTHYGGDRTLSMGTNPDGDPWSWTDIVNLRLYCGCYSWNNDKYNAVSGIYWAYVVVTYTPPWPIFAKVNGIQPVTLSKVNGVSLTSISKVNGISVS